MSETPVSEGVTEAARALLAKLDAITAHPAYLDVFCVAKPIRGEYEGPQCEVEMGALRAALDTVLSESEAWDAFSAAVAVAGGVRAFARLAGVAPSFVSSVMHGHVRPSDTLFRAAGIERTVIYRRVPEARHAP